MTIMKTVDDFLARQECWQTQLVTFRQIFLNTGLEETIKWGMPVYTLQGKLVAGLAAFKSYVGVWFYQGAFLSDAQKVLVNAQEGKTKAMRQLRFTSEEEVDYPLVKAYIEEAIQNQKAGLEVKPEMKKPLDIPAELLAALKADGNLKNSFGKFSVGKQREFTVYVSEGKQASTRLTRLQKIIPMIKDGVGLNDKYRK
jgi:uncharacterized protein YdeI (YjbR/CyaY-like superfamily)